MRPRYEAVYEDEDSFAGARVIAGFRVKFPRGLTPFPAQLKVMERALRALTACAHALLESPTGTGKTAALLAATISWQHQYRCRERPAVPPGPPVAVGECISVSAAAAAAMGECISVSAAAAAAMGECISVSAAAGTAAVTGAPTAGGSGGDGGMHIRIGGGGGGARGVCDCARHRPDRAAPPADAAPTGGKPRWQAVRRGRRPGLYVAWAGPGGAQAEAEGYSGKEHKAFAPQRRAEAEACARSRTSMALPCGPPHSTYA